MTTAARTTSASSFETAFEVLVTRARAIRTRRAQRIALAHLMEMDAHQLDDLGISAADVADALTVLSPAGPRLHAPRAARASSFAETGAAAAA